MNKIEWAALALVAALQVAALFAVGTSFPLLPSWTSEFWSGWAVAVGTIGAVGVAIYVPWRQTKDQALLRRQDEEREYAQRLYQVFLLASEQQRLLNALLESDDTSRPGLGDWRRNDYLARLRAVDEYQLELRSQRHVTELRWQFIELCELGDRVHVPRIGPMRAALEALKGHMDELRVVTEAAWCDARDRGNHQRGPALKP
jgi:hypothetical protein